MYKKLIHIKNYGKFYNYCTKNSDWDGSLGKINVISAPNGCGKTSLAELLRSTLGDSEIVTKKQTFGATQPPDIKFILDDNKELKFNGSWNRHLSNVDVFDSFYFEDMSIIGNNDSIYFMGIVPDKEGAIFSIYASGALRGETFKQYETYFSINTSTNITNINPAYTVNDYIINFKGEKYILIGIEKGTSQSTDSQTPEQESKKKKSTSFTWIFYVLGAGGAVGGVFLIMKLRKRVRAA